MIGLTMRSVTWNRFPIKNLWLIPCFFPLWSEITSTLSDWSQSTNHFWTALWISNGSFSLEFHYGCFPYFLLFLHGYLWNLVILCLKFGFPNIFSTLTQFPSFTILKRNSPVVESCFTVGLILEPREGWIVASSMLTPRQTNRPKRAVTSMFMKVTYVSLVWSFPSPCFGWLCSHVAVVLAWLLHYPHRCIALDLNIHG